MKVLELFAGTRSIGKAFERRGHEVYSIEWDKDFDHIDWYADIMTVTAQDILDRFGRPDVIWASPDCATFSIAAISHHRRKNPETGNLDPISEYAKFCDAVDQHVLRLILALSPMYWFIENPRGGMRKMTWMQGLPRYTVTYCQYGDSRMKPTDIDWWLIGQNPTPKNSTRHEWSETALGRISCRDIAKFVEWAKIDGGGSKIVEISAISGSIDLLREIKALLLNPGIARAMAEQ